MNRYGLNRLSFRRWASVLSGLLLMVFGGFYSFNISAKTENPPERNRVLGKLAYTAVVGTQSGGQYVIRTANADGTGVVQLIGSPPSGFNPSWSPDGTKIVFSSSDIYVMNADGTNLTNLTNTPSASEYLPSWSVTGKIAYGRDSRIWTMNADGTNQTQFVGITQFAQHPVWTADGSKLAYVSGGEIWKINHDGSNEQRVTTNTSAETYPSWSPDGTKIVFDKGSRGIAVVNADGTNEMFLTTNASDSSPAWSPDGSVIAFRRTTAGVSGIYVMNTTGGNQVRIIADTGNFPTNTTNHFPAWQPLAQPRRALFDFDGDAKADISVFRQSNGFWYELRSQNSGFYALQFGQWKDHITPADYDGDGKTDIAVWRFGTFAYFYIFQSSNNTVRYEQFGQNGDVPMSGDWDGDGKADPAVYRSANTPLQLGYYYYRPSTQPSVSYVTIQLGTVNRIPVYGDFDGDGKLDPAIYNPTSFLPSSVLRWTIKRSSDNQTVSVDFGILDDLPVPADYNGDGITDIAVFRPSTGYWYTSTNPAINFGAIPFGQAGDVPVPADYDGDGKADVAVYRPSTGVWYMLRSAQGFTGVAFGDANDEPIPNAYNYYIH